MLALLVRALAPDAQAQYQVRSLPNDLHYSSFNPYFQGDFVDAHKAFRSVPFMKTSTQRWVDSIPYHTMLGECLYQMGDLAGALQQYTTALQVFSRNSEWLLRVTVPDTLRPSNRAGRRGPTWGASSRVVRVADVPQRMQVTMGNSPSANMKAFQEGGTISSRYAIRIDAREIVRCTALAIRRRAEILGPSGQHDDVAADLINKLSRRPAPANWSQAWISVQIGLAYASKGKTAEAKAELQKSLLAGGMDHNLTSTALLELGKIAFKEHDYSTAGTLFFEAAYSAAMMAEDDFAQYDVVAEAFRWGAISHMITSPGTFSQAVGAAAEWARGGHRSIEASLLLTAAENCAGINDPKRAQVYLDRAAKAMRGRECRNGELGARHQFVTAQAAIQVGDSPRSAKALATALAYQRKGSRRLFHLGWADGLYKAGTITERQAGLLYADVLRDPTSHDWAESPLESLSVLTSRHDAAYERWLFVALGRKENDNALRIGEALRRHRFYTSLSLGGRILNLRWTLEAAPEALPKEVVLQRQDILNRYPAFTELSQVAKQLRGELSAMPMDSEDPAEQTRIGNLQRQLEGVGQSMEQILEVIALSRESSESVFPPATDPAIVQDRLAPGQRVLAYLATHRGTLVFMFGGGKYTAWNLSSPTRIRANVAKMLREMGQFDRNQPVGLTELESDGWSSLAVDVLKSLTADAPPEAWDEFEELVIVPDGMLWYVPFEALQIQDGDKTIPVIEKVRIRYAPTVSLAIPDGRPRLRTTRTAVVTGSLFPREGEAMSQELLDDLKAEDPEVFGVSVKPPPVTSILAKTIDRLVVMSDLDNDVAGPFDWAPMTVDRGRAAGSLAQWMKLPWGGPSEIILPGFHTPAENALKRGGTGEGMFLAICGLMSTGSRTVLVSRWRDGGRTSHELVREFVRELPHRSASQAWQRSVRLAVSSNLAWDQEPRVKDVPPDTPPTKASHPFFWGGYMLIDTGAEPVKE